MNRFVYSFALIGFGLVGAGCSDKEVGSGSGVAGSTPAVAAAQEEVTQERIGLPRDQIEGEILGEATGFLDGVPFTLYALNQQVEGYDEPVRTVHLSKVHDGYRLLVYFHPESVERRNNSLHLNLDLTPDLSLDEHKLGMYFTSPWVGYHFSGDFLTSFKAEWVVEDEIMKVSARLAGTAVDEATGNEVVITDGEVELYSMTYSAEGW